jgi:hypothetical protein
MVFMFQCGKHMTVVSVIIPVIINAYLVGIHGPQSSPAVVMIRVRVFSCLVLVSSCSDVKATCAVQLTHSWYTYKIVICCPPLNFLSSKLNTYVKVCEIS